MESLLLAPFQIAHSRLTRPTRPRLDGFYLSFAQAPPRRRALKRELFLIAGARSDRGITGALAAAATKTRVQMSVNFGALWLRKIGAADN